MPPPRPPAQFRTHRRIPPVEEVSELLEKGFGESFRSQAETFWRWKYSDGPAFSEDGSEPIAFTMEADGKVVGFLGLLPTRIRCPSGLSMVRWGADLVVDSHYRGQGVRFLRYCMKQVSDAPQLGTPNRRAYWLQHRLGYVDVAPQVHRRCLHRPAPYLRAKGWPGPAATAASVGWYVLLASWRQLGRLFRFPPATEVTEVDGIDERFDELWTRVSPDYPALAIRDGAFLRWRFERCPHRAHFVLAATRERELVGYIVGTVAAEERVRRGKIIDFLVRRDDADAFEALVDSAVSKLTAENTDLIECIASKLPRRFERTLCRQGFLFRKKRPPVVVSPEGGDPKHLAEHDWFFTAADSDIGMG